LDSRLLPRLGDYTAAELEPHDIVDLVAGLSEAGLRKQTIRKTTSVLAMILDHHGIQPNPARDPRVKLPREEKREVSPPSAEHVLAVFALLPSAYRLALLALDGTGMRVGELEALAWETWTKHEDAGVSVRPSPRPEQRGGCHHRSSCSQQSRRSFPAMTVSLSGRCSAVSVPTASEPLSREPAREPVCRVSPRTTSATARVSLLHAQGLSWARIGEFVGHGDLVTTARTYTHVLADEQELDYAALIA